MWKRLIPSVLIASACFDAPFDHVLGTPDSGTPNVRCRQLQFYDEQVCATVGPVVCGGQTCASGQLCCQTTGACIERGASCPVITAPGQWGDAKPCGSVADCGPEEFCMLDSLPGSTSCIGSGHCQSITNCGYCSPPGSDHCKVCGCDGVTYESQQMACVAGVSPMPFGSGLCGVSKGLDGGAFTYSCASSAQCPANSECCPLTNRCYDRSQPWRCERRADGGILNCANSTECNYGPGSGGGSGSEQPYCAGDGCAEGPGVCARPFSVSQCSGVVNNVCGCDGRTYVNECWARAAGVRIASNGACP